MAFSKENFYKKVREYLIDAPEENELLGKNEISDVLLEVALSKTLADINTTPPMLSYTINSDNISDATIINFLDGVVANVYFGLAMKEKRNQLMASDTGASVDDSHRHEAYLTIYRIKREEFLQIVSNIKQAEAAKEAWGHASSPWSFFGYFGTR